MEGHKSPELFGFWSLHGLSWFHRCWLIFSVNLVLIKLFKVLLHMDPLVLLSYLKCRPQSTSEPFWVMPPVTSKILKAWVPFISGIQSLQNVNRNIRIIEIKALSKMIWYALHGKALYECKWILKTKGKFNKLFIIYIPMTKLHMEPCFHLP